MQVFDFAPVSSIFRFLRRPRLFFMFSRRLKLTGADCPAELLFMSKYRLLLLHFPSIYNLLNQSAPVQVEARTRAMNLNVKCISIKSVETWRTFINTITASNRKVYFLLVDGCCYWASVAVAVEPTAGLTKVKWWRGVVRPHKRNSSIQMLIVCDGKTVPSTQQAPTICTFPL